MAARPHWNGQLRLALIGIGRAYGGVIGTVEKKPVEGT